MREYLKPMATPQSRRPDRCARPSSEQGFVIIVVLLITAILVAVVVEFSYSVYLSTARAGNFMNGQKAALLAGRAMEFAGAAVDDLLKRNPNLTIEKGGLVFFESEDGMTVTIRVVDELGKLSLRTVYEGNGVRNDTVHEEYSRLLENLQIENIKPLEGALADWIDSDDDPRLYGAEAGDYRDTRGRPFKPGNAYLQSADDLLMVKGYTPEAFGLIRDFVSVYNTDGLVNINTAPEEVLMTLSDDMTETLARRIIDARAEAPFKNGAGIMKVEGFETLGFDMQDKITATSDTFRIYAKVTSGEITREAEAVYKIKGGFVYWREM